MVLNYSLTDLRQPLGKTEQEKIRIPKTKKNQRSTIPNLNRGSEIGSTGIFIKETIRNQY